MTTVALGEVVNFYSGGTPSKSNAAFWQGDVPWFSAKDMKHSRLTDSADHVSEEVFSTTPLRKLPAGTIAVVVRGMILAHTVPISILDVEAAINQDLKALLPKRPLDTSYLAAVLRAQHASILSQVSTAAHGTKKLESRVLENLRIPLPPLVEQRRIAAIFDRADALRAKRRQALTQLDALTQSVFVDMFDDTELDLVPAGELMPAMRNGLSPASGGGHVAQVLTLSAVTQGTFDPSHSKVGNFAADPPADKRVTSSDFLMCRGNGNRDLVGVGTFSRADRPDLVFPDTVIAGSVDESRIRLPFLEVAWRQQTVRHQIVSRSRTTNGTYKVNQKSLSSVLVGVPSIERQDEFVRVVGGIGASREQIRRAATADELLFASLQARAFGGDL